MTICELTIEQIEILYNERMVHDFPRNERKPLSKIKSEIKKGGYEAYGLFYDDKVRGYAFFVKLREGDNNNYLLDYFAIDKLHRSEGLGSIFFNMLTEHFKSCNSVLIEVENPEYAIYENDKIIQQKRFDFYIRNGCYNSGVKVRVFGVEYLILEMPLSDKHSQDEIKYIYSNLYKSFLPKLIYATNIKIK